MKPLKRLLALPNDPLARYVAKGEIKPRYFNPGDFFDEIHVVTLAATDVAPDEVQATAGRAALYIHPIGRPKLTQLNAVRRRVLALAESVQPQVIRAYNPLYMGYLAAYCGHRLGLPSVVSVHGDYDLWRCCCIHGWRFLATARGAYQLAHGPLGWNRFMFRHATRIVCAYEFPRRYVERWRQDGVQVIYNRVPLSRFCPVAAGAPERPVAVLNLGRQFAGKDPTPLLRAVAECPGVSLTLVGDGPYHARLVGLARDLGISERVEFRPRVPYDELPALFQQHDLFAMAITHPGICIPVLEAAASGLPVIVNQPRWEPLPELIGDLAEVVPLTAAGYRDAILALAADADLRRQRGLALRERVMPYDGERMEAAERDLYAELTASEDSARGRGLL